MKKSYRFIYQCRRCTARSGNPVVFDTGITVETAVPVALLEAMLSGRPRLVLVRDQQPTKVVHQCGELTVGVADLIGMEPV